MFTEMREHVFLLCQRDRDWGHKERKEEGKKRALEVFQDGTKVERSNVHSPVRGETAGPGAQRELGLLPAIESFYFYLLMKSLWQYHLFFMDYWSIWSEMITDVYKYKQNKKSPKNFTLVVIRKLDHHLLEEFSLLDVNLRDFRYDM